MDFLTLTTIVATVSTLLLGTFVFIKNTRSRTHQLFGLYCIFVALWSLVTFLSLAGAEKSEMLFWVRMVMALATAQSVTIFLFILTFPYQSFTIKRRLLFFILSAGAVTFLLCLTPFVFSDIELSSEGEVQETIVAPGIIPFILVTIGAIIFSIILSFRNYIDALGMKKIQFQYIFFSLVLMYMGIVFFSFVQPVFFQNPNYVYLGSLFTLPFIFLTAYAMLRYRLMDIKVVVRKSIIYAVSLFITLGLYTYFALVLKTAIEESWDINPTWAAVVLIAVVALGFPQLKKLVEKLVNRLFKGKKSIDLAVRELRERIAKKTDLDELIEVVTKNIKQYLGVKELKFFMLDRKENKLTYSPDDYVHESFGVDSDLVRYYDSHWRSLVREEIPHIIDEVQDERHKQQLQKVEKEMKKKKYSLIIAFKTEDEIIGLLALGDREKKEAYTVQDVEYLKQLREQVIFTLASALQYRDVMERIQSNVTA